MAQRDLEQELEVPAVSKATAERFVTLGLLLPPVKNTGMCTFHERYAVITEAQQLRTWALDVGSLI